MQQSENTFQAAPVGNAENQLSISDTQYDSGIQQTWKFEHRPCLQIIVIPARPKHANVQRDA